MKTEKIITLDLAVRGAAIQIGESAVAGDHGSRYLVFSLTQEGVPWTVPEDAKAALAFRTEGGCSGEYDTLPDGTEAFRVEENRVTVMLVDQILAKPGWVRLMLVLRRDLTEQLSAFPVQMTVTEPIGGGEALPGKYYRISDLEQLNEELVRIDYLLDQLRSENINSVNQHNTSPNTHTDIRLRMDKLSTTKLDADKLPGAIETALSQAKDSGAFDGKTPVKGVDYFTAADQAEMVQAVVAALPKYAGEVRAV